MLRTMSQSLMCDGSSSGSTKSSAMEPTSRTNGCHGLGSLAVERGQPSLGALPRPCCGPGADALGPHLAGAFAERNLWNIERGRRRIT